MASIPGRQQIQINSIGFNKFHRMLEQIRLNEKLLEDLEINDNLFDLLPKKITQAKLILAATINEGKENAAL